jgi:hypothetical protein
MIQYNSTAPTLLTGQTVPEQADCAGSVYSNNEGRKATYRAVTSGVVVTANGVLMQIIGSATKTVRINRIACNGILTTAGMVLVQVNRTTAAASSVSNAVVVTPRPSWTPQAPRRPRLRPAIPRPRSARATRYWHQLARFMRRPLRFQPALNFYLATATANRLFCVARPNGHRSRSPRRPTRALCSTSTWNLQRNNRFPQGRGQRIVTHPTTLGRMTTRTLMAIHRHQRTRHDTAMRQYGHHQRGIV